VLCVEDSAEIRRLHRAEQVPVKAIARMMGSGGGLLELSRLFGISDPAAISECAESGPRGYDEHQAPEGAAGSAGRTESTSVSR